MARTYEQHLAAVLAANPTPIPTWYLHVDNASHAHDDRAIAQCAMEFDGESYIFEMHVRGNTRLYFWMPHRVKAEFKPRQLWIGTRSLGTIKTEFQLVWDTWCTGLRAVMAVEAHAIDILIDDGIGVAPVIASTAATATLAGLMPHSAWTSDWTLAPTFAPDTFAYAFNALNDTFVPVAELGFAGQTVFWKHGQDAYTGMVPVITLNSGENIITITVVSANGQNVKTYTLTITRE